MDKAYQISKVIDRLNDAGKDKLLTSARHLLKSQRVVKGAAGKQPRAVCASHKQQRFEAKNAERRGGV